jgi:ribosomal protein S12 methylthiotransferase accessory factor
MQMKVSFPGGAAVDAAFKGHSFHTDQPLACGGGDSAGSPFDLFLASMGTCMGFYALRFCQERGIPTEGLSLALEFVKDPETKRLSKVHVEVAAPEDFPRKYRPALLRAVDQCAVKKAILEPPEFDVTMATEALVQVSSSSAALTVSSPRASGWVSPPIEMRT